MPPLRCPTQADSRGFEALGQYDAVALFIERAEAVKADFTVTDENAPAVAEICVRLDGLPLAIELAAARVRALPPQALLSRLDQRLKLLTGGAHDLDERQRTLRATIDWSYELLAEEERSPVRAARCVRRWLSPRGSRGRLQSRGDDRLDILDGLSSLVEQEPTSQKEDPDGEPRFWMLETIREYALDSLDTTGEARRVSMALCIALSERRGGSGATSARASSEWVDTEARGRARQPARVTHLPGTGRPAVAVRLCGALWHYWSSQGFWTEGRESLERALHVRTHDQRNGREP